MQDVPTVRQFSPTRLREAAEAAGMTQQRIAVRLDMSMRAVQKWFLGEGQPTGHRLIALAELLEREPVWFYVAKNDEPEPQEAAA